MILRQRSIGAIRHRIEQPLGGPARTRVVVLLACVLALESADLATVGACAPQLEADFHISNAQLGLLAAISTLVGALATVPVGALTDRVHRVHLLAAAIGAWALAMVVSATAQTYDWLLLSRFGLGAVTAAAGPLVASLTGDLFRPGERGTIYGYVLSGELLGAAVGYVVCGSVSAALSWRWAFAVLSIPALLLALALRHWLAEPARGGSSRLAPGARRMITADEADAADGTSSSEEESTSSGGAAREAVLSQNVEPVSEHILDRDPAHMRLRSAVRYVLSIRTNRWLIAASAIGYFFFAGMRTFALVFVRGHYALGQAQATAVLFLAGLGAVCGVVLSGRVADRLIRHGHVNARVVVAAVSYLAAVAVLIPAFVVPSMTIGIPLLTLAGVALAAPNPPLDAARLDVVPARLWGRAEGVRTLLRQSAQAAAPLVFGLVADALGGGSVSSSAHGAISPEATRALTDAFLLMLIPLGISSVALMRASRSYPADVATAVVSEQRRSRRGATRPVDVAPAPLSRSLTARVRASGEGPAPGSPT